MNRVGELLRRVEAGERLTITVDRRLVVELVPFRRRRAVSMSQARLVAQRHPIDRRLSTDISEVIPDTTDDEGSLCHIVHPGPPDLASANSSRAVETESPPGTGRSALVGRVKTAHD
jgi:antitoxin (DNA-binding transcriptional repressor) of toxin-antitoxin stability system